MEKLTQKDVDMLSHLLRAEGMACKKARLYANTLTDTQIAEELAGVAEEHETRFRSLYLLLSGEEL